MTDAAIDVETMINGPDWLGVAIDIPGLEADDAISWFVEAERLKRWWGSEHDIEPRQGGHYIIRWPHIDRILRGRIAEMETRRLMFSWSFDHEPEVPLRVVAIQALPIDGGTRIEIRHGCYRADGSDAEERDGHHEGWAFFLPQLANAIRSAAPE